MAEFHGFRQRFNQLVDLRRADSVPDQAFRHRGQAPELAESLQHEKLRLVDAIAGYRFLDLPAIAEPAFIVYAPLPVAHFHVDGLVDTLRKVGEHISLQPPQDKGEYLPAQASRRIFVAIFLDRKRIG